MSLIPSAASILRRDKECFDVAASLLELRAPPMQSVRDVLSVIESYVAHQQMPEPPDPKLLLWVPTQGVFYVASSKYGDTVASWERFGLLWRRVKCRVECQYGSQISTCLRCIHCGGHIPCAHYDEEKYLRCVWAAPDLDERERAFFAQQPQ